MYTSFSELAESYVDAATVFGTLVAVDPASAPEPRKDVFPEFLAVGLQQNNIGCVHIFAEV